MSGLQKKYYDGSQVFKILTQVITDGGLTLKLLKRFGEEPSAERKGKWVNNIHDMPICSECGYMTPYDRAIDDYEYGNYCPNCGARMVVGDE